LTTVLSSSSSVRLKERAWRRDVLTSMWKGMGRDATGLGRTRGEAAGLK
jgi:hypothetical protein